MFKHRWPDGYPTYVLLALQNVLEDPRFQAEVGSQTAPSNIHFHDRVNELLRQKPLCCRMGATRMIGVLLEVQKVAKPFDVGICSHCNGWNRALCVPYLGNRPLYPFCIRCAVNGSVWNG